MARTLSQELQNILSSGCIGRVATENLPEDDRQLGHLINQLLGHLEQEKSNRLAMKSTLLNDIDALTEVLEKISLGNFRVKAPVMRLAEMDTMQIGVYDMARKLEKNMQEVIQSEQQVRKMERKYRHIFEHAIEGLFQISPDGRFLTANPSLCQQLGYECCEQLQQGPTPYLSACFARPEDRTNYETILRETGKLSGFTCQLKRSNGEVFWAKISLRASSGKGQPSPLYEGFLLDITESKEKEKAEKERRIAEESGKAKSQFLANMSHEIRTPLNAIIGFNRLVLESPLPPDLHHYISNVQESAELLLVLLNDILDFSKIDAGQLDLNDEVFDLPAVIDGAMKVLAIRAEEKGLRLTSHMDDVPCTSLVGDDYRLRQILLNLLGNSIKFTERGGVSVHTKIYAETKDSVVLHFQVVDSGPGIPAEAQGRIFGSFCQADNSITRLHGGSGLGLAISKKLVNLLGGEIWLSSYAGRGTTFHFTVKFKKDRSESTRPVDHAPPQPVTAQAAAVMTPAGTPLSILLVEDNKFNVDLAQIMLECAGHQVTVALNGFQAINALRANQFDLVLMDIQMPEMDGIMATRLIRACETGQDVCHPEYQGIVNDLEAKLKGRHLPIIAMTANSMSGDREKYVAAGMDDYVSKPYLPEEIFSALQRTVLRQDTEGSSRLQYGR